MTSHLRLRQGWHLWVLGSLLTVALVLLWSCAQNGAERTAAPVLPGAQPETSQLNAPVPAGVDPALWARLTAELARVVAREGTLRRASSAPVGKGSAVPDLGYALQANIGIFHWSYRQHGDYDLNGSVTLGDLTPVGLHFGKTTLSPDWQRAQLADGDGNGEVNINDVTSIGQNFGGRVDGYEFQSRQDDASPWALAGEHAFLASDVPAGSYAQYAHLIQNFVAGAEYRVVPFTEEDSVRSYGPGSNICRTLTPDRCWPTQRANHNRDGLCQALGPDTVAQSWSLPLAGTTMMQEPISDMTGTIYLGTAESQGQGDEIEGTLHAVNPDGSLRWTFRTLGGILSSAAANRFGNVVVGDTEGIVYCLKPDGKQLWHRQLLGMIMYANPLIEDDGTVYILTQMMSGNELVSSTLFRLDPEGAVDWSRPLTGVCTSAPFPNDQGDVTVVDKAGMLYSFNETGNPTQSYLLPDLPDKDFLAGGVLAYGPELIYTTDNDSFRIHLFNNMMSIPCGLGEDGVTMPVLNTVQRMALGTQTAADVLRLNLYDGTNLAWAMDLPGTLMSNIAVDRGDNMYLATYDAGGGLQTGNGVSRVQSDQTASWFFPTGTALPSGVIVAGDGLIVCVTGGFVTADMPTLVGIRGD